MPTVTSRLLAGSLFLSAFVFVACRDSGIEPPARRQARASLVASPSYAVVDLGTLGGATSAAYSINSEGQIVGSSQTAEGLTHAFLWQEGVMTDLGTLGGPSSAAYAINGDGYVVGWSQLADGQTHAFLWKDGVMSDLGTLGGTLSYAYAINSRRQVAGNAMRATGAVVAFVWQNGVMTGLVGSKFSVAQGVNARGQVVGASEQFTDYQRATLWYNGATTNLGLLVDIPLHFIPQSAAYAINAPGQIVGASDIQGYTGPRHAFLWQNGVMADLGTLGGDSSAAHAISAQGHAVGYSELAGGLRHAVLWQNGEMTDLGLVTGSAAALDAGARLAGEADVGGYGESPDRQLTDLALVASPPTDTAVFNALVKIVRNSKMAHCCRRQLSPSDEADAASTALSADVPSYATDINEKGQVVGYYYGAGSTVAHAVLWTPR